MSSKKKRNCAGPPPRVRMNPKPEKVETWEERKRGWVKTTHEGERSEPTRSCKPSTLNPKPIISYVFLGSSTPVAPPGSLLNPLCFLSFCVQNLVVASVPVSAMVKAVALRPWPCNTVVVQFPPGAFFCSFLFSFSSFLLVSRDGSSKCFPVATISHLSWWIWGVNPLVAQDCL